MAMQLLPQEQPPVDDDERLREFITRLVILLNGIIENIHDSEERVLIDLDASDVTNQAPSATDTELQIKFGAAQGDAKSRVQISAAGTITIQVAGEYDLDAVFSVTSTLVGSTVLIYVKVDDVIDGETVLVQVEAAGRIAPSRMSRHYSFEAGATLKFFIVRDSAGVNDGGLASFSPTGSIPDVASARLLLTRRKLVI